jgi:hypothetical protein
MTVTLRTLAAGPFILQRGGEFDQLDWEEGDIEVSDSNISTEHDPRTDERRADD